MMRSEDNFMRKSGRTDRRRAVGVRLAVLLMVMSAVLCACDRKNTEGTTAQTDTSAGGDRTEETAGEPTSEESGTAGESTAQESSEVPEPVSNALVSGDYVTYPFEAAEFLVAVSDTPAYLSGVNCTAMQGMAASEDYLYVAKQKNNQYATVFQYDPEMDTLVLMEYYDSPEATEQTALDCISHVNDMTIYTDLGQQYLITSATYTPDSEEYPGPCLTQLLLDEENAALRLAGFFNLKGINDAGESAYISAGGFRLVAQTEEYNYFLLKNGSDFYWTKMPAGAIGGTAEHPVELSCIHLFTIDRRNALVVNKDGEVEPLDNLECWTNQGCFYSPEEDLLYVQYYNQYTGTYAARESVIITFDMNGMLAVDALESVTENQTLRLYPTTLAFHLRVPSQSTYEIEGCVFRKNQGEDGDLTLYFNINGAALSTEGIWAYEYTRGSATAQSIVDEDSIIYTVEYNYNVEGVAESDWVQKIPNSNYSMFGDTTHIDGITTNLRINRFKRDGFTFAGWQLYRESDGKWLYADGNWYADNEVPAGLEKKVLKNAEPVDHLTTVNGDVITAYAQWKYPD